MLKLCECSGLTWLRSQTTAVMAVVVLVLSLFTSALSQPLLPIADAHVHYSHDSVDMTPPERVIELMYEAGLKFALVSSSDDRGTQLLSDLAPDLIIPGLRPYRQRGELNTWFKDPGALAYVEKLLATNRYASIGEFHLYGESADLEIPRRIVELAAEYNLVLHAHSDADAVERLLAQNSAVKVLWAHSGFDSPDEIASMLSKHDRLWADLAFRSEVGSGGQLSEDWVKLFTDHPDRMMLGTDTYTPERIYFMPEHANNARVWLAGLPADLAEKVAWKNAHDLLMSIWEINRLENKEGAIPTTVGETVETCVESIASDATVVSQQPYTAIETLGEITVSKPFSILLTVCGVNTSDSGGSEILLDAFMPAHGHGMNYSPEYTVIENSERHIKLKIDSLLLHMPGDWQWRIAIKTAGERQEINYDFQLQ